MNKSTPENFQPEQKLNEEPQPIVSTSPPAIGNTNVVGGTVGVPCEICGEILIVEKGIVADEDCDIPPLCGKCYTEYYADYMESLRTGYRM